MNICTVVKGKKKERGSTEKSSPGKKQALKKAEEEWQVILDNFKFHSR